MQSESTGLRLHVLGEVTGTYDGAPLDLGGRRQRAVLAQLLIARGDVVPAEKIADGVWGEDLPGNVSGALQSYVSHLRRRLEPGATARGRSNVIVSEGSGYAVRLDRDAVDAWEFEVLVKQASERPTDAGELLLRAISLWRGPALIEYADEPWAAAEVARLEELRNVAREQLFDVRLREGQAALCVPDLEALVSADPLREERWRLLVLALYRSGRQADALAALRRAKATLADELGVDVGPALRQLEQEVLQQSPHLDLPVQRPTPVLTTSGDDLIDRSREVQALDQALDEVQRGGSQVLLVEGPAGIGKSRLLLEARTLAGRRSLPVLLARGSQLERSFGFGVVRQLLEPLLTDAARREELLSGAAASARGVFETVEQDQRADGSFAVLHGLYWLTVNLAADGPLVLAVDDLQWCDSGSLRFLAYLAGRLETLPVLLLGTVRTGEAHEDEALLAELYGVAGPPLRPGPLSPHATADMVRARLGAHAAPSFVTACHRTTTGNPLLLRQLLRALEADGVRPDAAHADTVMAVGSRAVSSMVLMRLRRMPPGLTAVARAVAVLGEGAQLPEVAELAELAEADAAAALADLTRAEIVRPEQPLGFVHPLVRDAVYRDLPPGQRELQHQRAAAVLQTVGAPYEQVAAHLMLAPRRGDREAVALLRAAARTAADRGAADSAVTYLRRALEEPALAGDRVDVLLELGLLETLVDGPSGVVHLEQVYPFLEAPAVRGEIAIGIARNHVFASERGVATRFARSARHSLPPELVDVHQGLVALERISAFMHGLDPAEWRGEEPPSVVGRGHGALMLAANLAWERVVEGKDRQGAVELARIATETGRLFDVDNGLLWIVAANSRILADDDVGDFWERAQASAHRRGSLFAAMSTNLWRGFDEWRRGDLPEALASMSVASEQQVMWQGGRGIGTTYSDAFLARVHLDRGDVAAAREAVDRSLAEPSIGEGWRLVQESGVAVLVAEGRYAEALALYDAITDTNDILNPAWRPWRSLRASVLAGLGRHEEALRLVVEELELARRWGAPLTLGRTLLALGALTGDLAALREAVAVLTPTRARLELARAQLTLGSAAGMPDPEAGPLLRAAYEGAHRCGSPGLRDSALAALAARGIEATPCDEVVLLTTTERRVLDLAESGLDVRQVAQRLFLTPGSVQATLDTLASSGAQVSPGTVGLD